MSHRQCELIASDLRANGKGGRSSSTVAIKNGKQPSIGAGRTTIQKLVPTLMFSPCRPEDSWNQTNFYRNAEVMNRLTGEHSRQIDLVADV